MKLIVRAALLVGIFSLNFLATPSSAEARLLEAGQSFPDWSMQDQAGQPISSADLSGKTYLLWYYPKAMTPGCTVEGQGLRDSQAKFAAQGVEILGVSFDTPADNAAFARAEGFSYRLLSDDGALAVQVGAASSRGQGYARRISYLVGPDGKILQAYGSVRPAQHAQQVLADLPGN